MGYQGIISRIIRVLNELIKGLKDHKGQAATEKSIIAKTKTVFDNIFAFSGTENENEFKNNSNFHLNQIISAKNNILFFNSGLLILFLFIYLIYFRKYNSKII